MTVEKIAALIPGQVKIELSFDSNTLEYDRRNLLHVAGFGNMIVKSIVPWEDGVGLNIRSLPERM